MARWSEDERHARGFFVALALAALALGSARFRLHSTRSPATVTFARAPRAPASARIAATLEPGKITLDGAVRSEAERANLVATARGAFPTSDVEDHLELSVSSEANASTTSFRAVLAEARAVRWGTLFVTEAGLTLRGDVRDDTDLRELARDLRAVSKTPIELALVPTHAPVVDANVLESALRVLFTGPLMLPWKRAELDAQAKATLEPLVDAMDRLEMLEVTISAVPNVAEPASDWDSLALARAEAIRQHLGSRGVVLSRLRATAEHAAPVAPRPKGTPEPAKVAVDVRFSVREIREAR